MKCTSRKFITGKFSSVLSEFRPQIMHPKEVVPLLTLQSHIKYTVSLFFFKSLHFVYFFPNFWIHNHSVFRVQETCLYMQTLCVCVRTRVLCSAWFFVFLEFRWKNWVNFSRLHWKKEINKQKITTSSARRGYRICKETSRLFRMLMLKFHNIFQKYNKSYFLNN